MHAVLITAYKDYPSLLRLVRRLDPEFFKIFIHIDRKSRISDGQMDELRSLGADISKRLIVRWGSYSHLEAILSLMAGAVERGGCDYVHIISGQDYPLWEAKEFERRCDGRIFMGVGALAAEPQFVRERYELGDPFHRLLTGPPGSGHLHKFLTRKSLWLRRLFSKRRAQFGPFTSLHKALVWSSLPTSAAVCLLQDPIAHAFLHAIRDTRVAEEIFLATYFSNSKLAPLVVSNDLRYADWRERNGSKPAYLDLSDLEPVLRSGALFVRKMSSGVSTALLDAIDAERFVSSG